MPDLESKKIDNRAKPTIDDEDLNQIRFSTLVDLFEALDINEKGIEIVYDYLLRNQMIDDPKSIFEDLGLSLKRIYKILGVLKDMGLIQVYDRPMKIYKTDVTRSWQEIISEYVKKLRAQLADKVNLCENSLRRMLKAYNVPEQPSNAPVEFISYDTKENSIEFLQNVFNMKNGCIIAKELPFMSPINEMLGKALINPSNYGYDSQTQLISELKASFSNRTIKLLISEEVVKENLEKITSTANNFLNKFPQLNEIALNIMIKVTPQPIGNIVIKDMEQLLQFSFAPNNQLIGVFISHLPEIVDIFNQKFTSIFDQAIDIQTYLLNAQKRQLTEFEKIYFVMV